MIRIYSISALCNLFEKKVALGCWKKLHPCMLKRDALGAVFQTFYKQYFDMDYKHTTCKSIFVYVTMSLN